MRSTDTYVWQGAYSRQGDVATASIPVGHWLQFSAPATNKPFWAFGFCWDGTPELFLKVENGKLLVSSGAQSPPFLTVLQRVDKEWTEANIEAAMAGATLTELTIDANDPSEVAKAKRFPPARLEASNISDAAGLPLEGLTALDTRVLNDSRFFERMTELKELSFVPGAHRFTGLESLKKLTSLTVNDAPAGIDISPLAALTELWELHFRDCTSIKSFEPIGKLRKLRALTLPKNVTDDDLKKLRETGVLDNLESLDLRSCAGLKTLKPLTGLTKLHTLNLQFCDGLTDFAALSSLPNLRALNLDRSDGLKDLSFLKPLSGLRVLSVQCSDADALKVLKDKDALEAIFIVGSIQDLSALPVAHLRELYLNGYKGSHLPANLRELQVVGLYNCENLDDDGVKALLNSPKLLTHVFYSNAFGAKFKKDALIAELLKKFPGCYLTF